MSTKEVTTAAEPENVADGHPAAKASAPKSVNTAPRISEIKQVNKTRYRSVCTIAKQPDADKGAEA